MKNSKVNPSKTEGENISSRKIIFATCFLKGAIPSSIIRDLKKDCYFAMGNPLWAENLEVLSNKQRLMKKNMVTQVDKLLDKRKIGPHFLQDERNKEILDFILRKVDKQSARIIQVKILSNHFHLLIDLSGLNRRNGSQQARKLKSAELVLKQIKKDSSEMINDNLQRIGPLWEDENFCLRINSEEMLQNVRNYITSNTCYLGRMKAFENECLLSKTSDINGRRTLIYSEFRPGIVG